jgi:hypothetical protein
MTTESAVMLVPPSFAGRCGRADRPTLNSRPRPGREDAPGSPAGPQPGPVARTRSRRYEDELGGGSLVVVGCVVVVGSLVVVGPVVVVDSLVVVGWVVVVVLEVVVGRVVVVVVLLVVVLVVVVVPGGGQPVTQNTLYLVSAPWEPSALIVSLTWKPWLGCGWIPVKSSV